MNLGWHISHTLDTRSGITLGHSLEEWDDFVGEDLSSAEALRVQHDLGDELPVGLGHGQAPEQLLEVVGKVGPACIARVHGDEDGHVRAHLHLLVEQLTSNGGGG